MNTQTEFLAAIERNAEGGHIALGGEPEGFRNSPCESCGSARAGDRFSAHLFPKGWTDREIGGGSRLLRICTDCLLFHANGDLPQNLDE